MLRDHPGRPLGALGPFGGTTHQLAGLVAAAQALGHSLQRGRVPMHSPDRLYDFKLALIRQAQSQAAADPVRFPFLYEEETTYYRRPRVGRAYGGVGQPGERARQYPGANTRRRIAGCVDIHSGALIAWQRTTFVVAEVVKFLRHVEVQYPAAQTISVAWDNWTNHVHPYVQETLAEMGSRIRLLSLPTYAPWTNPMEKVWLQLDHDVLDQHPFGQDWTGLKQAVDQWLQHQRKGSMDLLRVIGLVPPLPIPWTD